MSDDGVVGMRLHRLQACDCQKGARPMQTPCAVFHKKAGESLYGKVIKTSSDDLGSVVDSAKSDLADIAGAALPEASSVTPNPPIREDDTCYFVIRNEALEQRSVESVIFLVRSSMTRLISMEVLSIF